MTEAMHAGTAGVMGVPVAAPSRKAKVSALNSAVQARGRAAHAAIRGQASWSGPYIWKLRVSAAIVPLVVLATAPAVQADLEISRFRDRGVLGTGATECRRTAQATFRTLGAMAILMVVSGFIVPRGFLAVALPLGLALLMASRRPWRCRLGHRLMDRRLMDRTMLCSAVVVGSSQEPGWRLGDLDPELVPASSLTGIAGARVHVRPLEGLRFMHVELHHCSGGRHVLKRDMDVVPAAAALLVLSPLLLVLALVGRLGSPGRALFFQQRVGKGGQEFKPLKFRSMVPEELLLDLHHEGNWPVAGDLRILWRALKVVAAPVGAY